MGHEQLFCFSLYHGQQSTHRAFGSGSSEFSSPNQWALVRRNLLIKKRQEHKVRQPPGCKRKTWFCTLYLHRQCVLWEFKNAAGPINNCINTCNWSMSKAALTFLYCQHCVRVARASLCVRTFFACVQLRDKPCCWHFEKTFILLKKCRFGILVAKSCILCPVVELCAVLVFNPGVWIVELKVNVLWRSIPAAIWTKVRCASFSFVLREVSLAGEA